jgi:DNA-binding NarL/FixJ family response regulator
MHSERDIVAPLEEGRLLAGLIAGARFVQLDSDNHILLSEEPAWPRFLAEVRTFLRAGDRNSDQVGVRTRLAELTKRELEVLEGIAKGLANAQIAADLGLSEKTVRNHVTRLFDKLAIETRSRAIVLGREAGFGRGVGPGPQSR